MKCMSRKAESNTSHILTFSKKAGMSRTSLELNAARLAQNEKPGCRAISPKRKAGGARHSALCHKAKPRTISFPCKAECRAISPKHKAQSPRVLAVVVCVVLALSLVSCDCQVGTLSKIAQDVATESTLVMVYMAGANSLTSEVLYDLNAMEHGLYKGSSFVNLNMHVVALCDQLCDDSGSTWDGTRLYQVQPDINSAKFFPKHISSTLVKTASSSLGTWRTSSEQEEDMGDIETLKNFIYWARETYPNCSRQMLILWDHGKGISSPHRIYYTSADENSISINRNVCSDDETANNEQYLNYSLHIGELQELLEEIYPTDDKLEFLGFDACYMGLYEVAYQFRNCAKYMAASPTKEVGGWAYDYIFAQDNSVVSGKDFAINVVDGYYKKTGPGALNYDNAMTAFDLSGMDSLKTCVDTLASSVAASSLVASVPGYIVDYAKFLTSSSEMVQLYYYYFPYYELGSLLDLYGNENSDFTTTEKVAFTTPVTSNAFATKDEMKKVILKTWLSSAFTSGSEIYEENSEYGMGIFNAYSKYDYSKYNFYTDEFYTEDDSILGYGKIEAANLGTTYGTVETWRELQNKMYGKNITKYPY